jgi:hypothetical protein
VTLDALGATTSQKREVQRAFANFAESYAELEGHHITLTTSKEGETTGDGNEPMIVVERFANDCAPLKKDLEAELETALGRERKEVLWRHFRSAFRNAFNDFGERERTRILRKFKSPGQSMAFIEEVDEGNMTHGVSFTELPEAFKPFVTSWNEKKEETPR